MTALRVAVVGAGFMTGVHTRAVRVTAARPVATGSVATAGRTAEPAGTGTRRGRLGPLRTGR
jgi:hypothetical protein